MINTSTKEVAKLIAHIEAKQESGLLGYGGYVGVNLLRTIAAERDQFLKAMRQIAAHESHLEGDVVSIAEEVLARLGYE